MSVIIKWSDGELRARRTDGKPLTDADREQVKLQAKQPGVSVGDVLGVFTGAVVVAEDKSLFCNHCDKILIPEWDQLHQDAPVSKVVKLLERRRGKIVERVRPDGHRDWMCHGCGREAKG